MYTYEFYVYVCMYVCICIYVPINQWSYRVNGSSTIKIYKFKISQRQLLKSF